MSDEKVTGDLMITDLLTTDLLELNIQNSESENETSSERSEEEEEDDFEGFKEQEVLEEETATSEVASRACVPMTNSSALYLASIDESISEEIRSKNLAQLNARMYSDGYLWLPGVLNASEVGNFSNSIGVPEQYQGTYHIRSKVSHNTPGTDAEDSSKWPRKDRPHLKVLKHVAQPDEKTVLRELTNASIGKFCSGKKSRLQDVVRNIFGNVANLRPEDTWLRVKKPVTDEKEWNGTVRHADFFFFERDGFFEHKNALPHGNKLIKHIPCSLCAWQFPLKDGEEKTRGDDRLSNASEDKYCQTCAENYVPIYTCWVPLSSGNIESGDSLLEILDSSHWMTGFYGGGAPAGRYENQELPRWFHLQEKYKEYKWVSPMRVAPGDLIIFNCKTTHAAPSHKNSLGKRISLDIRVFDESFSSDIGNICSKNRLEKESLQCSKLILSVMSKLLSQINQHDEEDSSEEERLWNDQADNMVFLGAVLEKLRSNRNGDISEVYAEQVAKLSQLASSQSEMKSNLDILTPIHLLARQWFKLPISDTAMMRATRERDGDEDEKAPPLPMFGRAIDFERYLDGFEKFTLDLEDAEQGAAPDLEDWTSNFVLTWHSLQLRQSQMAAISPAILLLRHQLVSWALAQISQEIDNKPVQFYDLLGHVDATFDVGVCLKGCSDKIYFATHVIFCLSEWGQAPKNLSDWLDDKALQRFFWMFRDWLWDLLARWHPLNSEVMMEIATALLLVKRAICAVSLEQVQIPDEVQRLVLILLQTPGHYLRLSKISRCDAMTVYHTAFTQGFLYEVYLDTMISIQHSLSHPLAE